MIFSVAALAWNARRQIDNSFLLLVGLASPSIGALDLLHTLAYKGMNIFLYRALVLQGIRKPQFSAVPAPEPREGTARAERGGARDQSRQRTAEVTESNRRLQDELVERRRVEQQLLESEEMLRLTRNVALDATIVIDAADRVSGTRRRPGSSAIPPMKSSAAACTS